MISQLARTALAVLVIVGWVTALLWLSFSVAQTAVERSVTVPRPQAHCLPAQDAPCRH